jgi:hypothetical protein
MAVGFTTLGGKMYINDYRIDSTLYNRALMRDFIWSLGKLDLSPDLSFWRETFSMTVAMTNWLMVRSASKDGRFV